MSASLQCGGLVAVAPLRIAKAKWAGTMPAQEPRRKSPSVGRRDRAAPVEAVVDAGLGGAGLEPDIGRGQRRAIGEPAVHVAEVDEEIFGLGAPVRCELPFDATAGGPADACVGLTGEEGQGRVAHNAPTDVAERYATGDVRHPVARRRPAQPAADGPEPGVLGAAAKAGAARYDRAVADDAADRRQRRAVRVGAPDARPVEVAFDAPDHCATLDVETSRAAGKAAADVVVS